ncbi:MAG: UDP-2,3-diacylglucosamine diphosphatase LpxI [Nitrospiraceae bacterium]|nr:UDP-2,3-diacylglucosamine diphosphatase LpxI [Nitrospiraceae bacterium]
MKKLGLIAGMGELPIAIAEEARSQGYIIVAVGLEPLADRALASVADETAWISVAKLGTIINTLKKAGVKEAVMAGKVPKSLLYKSRLIPDARAVKVLFSLKDRSDDAILLAVAKELEKDGITLRDTTDFSAGLLTPDGVLTKKKPSESEWKDIRFGWEIAKEIGRIDVGQTVVVKDRAVMAVEAIEGTDEAIRRGGNLARGGAVVVKVAKPRQDMRFDVPAAGLDTLKTMQEVKARVLALEAGKSILMGREKVVAAANKAGITIVGYTPSDGYILDL